MTPVLHFICTVVSFHNDEDHCDKADTKIVLSLHWLFRTVDHGSGIEKKIQQHKNSDLIWGLSSDPASVYVPVFFLAPGKHELKLK